MIEARFEREQPRLKIGSHAWRNVRRFEVFS